MDASQLRIILLLVGAAIVGLIYFFGRPRRKTPRSLNRANETEPGVRDVRKALERVEPTLGFSELEAEAITEDLRPVHVDSDAARVDPDGVPTPVTLPASGLKVDLPASHDRIVSLYLQAKDGEMMTIKDIKAAADKAGLVFGELKIFHRLRDGQPDRRPIFSMANLTKPGIFNLDDAGADTRGVSFFMTLPGPLSALDAWETMLPVAQRMAEVLKGQLLDESFSALSRQCIAHVRDDLRNHDRQVKSVQRPQRGFW